MNPRNGICLCALHDRAFDAGLLIITPDYRVNVHQSVTAAPSSVAVAEQFIRYEGQNIHMPDRWQPDPDFLRRHAELVCARAL